MFKRWSGMDSFDPEQEGQALVNMVIYRRVAKNARNF
jgi:hypothetical protein